MEHARDGGQFAGQRNQEWLDQFPGEIFEKEVDPKVLKVKPEWKLGSNLVFSTWGDSTVTNTTVETTLVDANIIGSKTFPRNFWIPGRIVRFTTRGVLTAGNVNATVRIKVRPVGGAWTMLIENTGSLQNLTNEYAELSADIFCTTEGKLRLLGRTLIHNGNGVTSAVMRELISAEVTIDPTKELEFDHTYQWDVASIANNITIRVATMELLR